VWAARGAVLPDAVTLTQADVGCSLDEVVRFGLEELVEDQVRDFLARTYFAEAPVRFEVLAG